jgi:Fe-S cluster biogenesis protein NfuA
MKLTREQRDAITVRAQDALNDLRPFLEADGGDISLEEITADGVAHVKLHGACCGCSMSPMTMKAGVEEAIKRMCPEIKRVEAVNAVMMA